MMRSFALRCRWLCLALGRNPLVRATDRLEALAVLVVFAVALIAIPFASQAGDDAYDARLQVIDQQMRTTNHIAATAVGGTAMAAGRYNRPGPVRVQWKDGTETRTALVSNPTPVAAGDTVTVWTNSAGEVVSAPETPQQARAIASGRAWTVWGSTVAFVALGAAAARFGLDRLRAQSWERELLLLAHNDDGWADQNS